MRPLHPATTALTTAILTKAAATIDCGAAARAAAAAVSIPAFLPSGIVSPPLAAHRKPFVSSSQPLRVPFSSRRGVAPSIKTERAKMAAADEPGFFWDHLTSVGSTQDEARERLGADGGGDPQHIAISASEQSKGRGTSGRDWIGRRGNTFVSICVPSDNLSFIPITLLPLKVGSIVADQVGRRLKEGESAAKVSVKWPNDVLVDDRKIAGILIENHYDTLSKTYWFLVGVGINLAHAPEIEPTGPKRGRRSTCLADHCTVDEDGVRQAQDLAGDIARGLHEWVQEGMHSVGDVDDKSVASAVVSEWSSWAEFGKNQVMRDKPGNEVVTPVGIEADGQLRVRDLHGKESLLCSDYLL